MLRLALAAVAALVASTAIAAGIGAGSAQEAARVRVVHASPDAPNVDVYADGARVLADVPFGAASDYLDVPAGPHNFQVFAAGADPASDAPVIDADATLGAGKDYTIIALGLLEDIAPAVFEDNNAAPAAGKAHVRVIHASPDAPDVDIAVTGGPTVFSGLPFGEAQGPTPVDAATYDLEVRAAGTDTVALALPDVALTAGKMYTVIAIGLLNGEPELQALTLVDDPRAAVPAPAPTAGAGTTPPVAAPDAGMGIGRDSGTSAAWFGLAALAAVAGTGTLALALTRRRG